MFFKKEVIDKYLQCILQNLKNTYTQTHLHIHKHTYTLAHTQTGRSSQTGKRSVTFYSLKGHIAYIEIKKNS